MLTKVPLTDLLIIVLLLLFMLAIVQRLTRHSRQDKTLIASSQSSPTPGEKLKTAAIYVLRLAGFTLLAIFVIGGTMLIYKTYQELKAEVAPAPSKVEIPNGLNLPLEEVTFTGGDGVILVGWYVPPHNGATIILMHGYGGNRLHTVWYAEQLIAAGYGVLMYDERASGESGGWQRSYGWQDAPDVGGALAFLEGRAEADTIRAGIAGCSIGGQIALQGAANYPQFQAVWADGPSVIRASDNPPPENWGLALAYASNLILDRMMAWKLDIQAPPAMIDILPQIAPRPVMLVAGGSPKPYLGSEELRIRRYAQYAGANALVWIIDEAYHCDGPQRRPQEYAARLVDFFDQAFGFK
jgi:pimeloyl-ACP methyl ester carboxylesterase